MSQILVFSPHGTIQVPNRPRLDKRSRYTPDLIPAAISVDYENSVSTLTTPSDSPQLLLLTSDDPNPCHAMKKDEPCRGRVKMGYCSRKCDKKMLLKWGFIAPRALIKTRIFITVIFFPGIIQRWGLASWTIDILQPFIQLIGVFASLLSFTLPVELVFVLVFFLFHWSHPVPIPMSALLENLTLCCFYWLFESMWWQAC